MSKSIIYAGNNATQVTTEAGTIISFPSIVRRYGCNLNVSGGNAVCSGQGYFSGIVNLTVNGTAAGTAAVSVLSNGTAIPFANASVETTTTSVDSISIPFTVRNTCNCIDNTITVEVSGVATNIVNAAISIEKE